MPVIDPALNQTVWWFVLGAFCGWLLWLLIDRLFWRDGLPADGHDPGEMPAMRSELEAARREESLLRSELVREQEETQRLVTLSKELRDRLDGQDQIVANLEAALDAARYSSPGAAAAIASASAAHQATDLAATASDDDTTASTPTATGPDTVNPDTITARTTARVPDDGEQALRDLLAQTEAHQDLDEIFGSDDDLFGAPTEILSPGQSGAGQSPSAASSSGPLSDDELDRLLDLDTQSLFGELENDTAAHKPVPSDVDPDSAAPDLGGPTLNMFERLKDSDEDHGESGPGNPAAGQSSDANEQQAEDTGLIGRLRGAFSRRPTDPRH